LDIGYSPALRDPAGRDGLLDIEDLAVLLKFGCYVGYWMFRVGYWILKSAVLLDIGYSPALRDPAGRDGLLVAILLDIGYSVLVIGY